MNPFKFTDPLIEQLLTVYQASFGLEESKMDEHNSRLRNSQSIGKDKTSIQLTVM